MTPFSLPVWLFPVFEVMREFGYFVENGLTGIDRHYRLGHRVSGAPKKVGGLKKHLDFLWKTGINEIHFILENAAEINPGCANVKSAGNRRE